MLAPVNDIVSPDVYANPELLHARYARYRREEPVTWIDQEPYRPFWAVTRHADHPGEGKALLDYLSSTQSSAVIRDTGMSPVTSRGTAQ